MHNIYAGYNCNTSTGDHSSLTWIFMIDPNDLFFFPLNVTRNVWTVARKNSLLKALWNILLKLHFKHSFLTLFPASFKVSLCCFNLMLFFFFSFLVCADKKGTSCFNPLLGQPMIHPPARGALKCRYKQATPLPKIFFFWVTYKILPDWISQCLSNSAILCVTHFVQSTHLFKK